MRTFNLCQNLFVEMLGTGIRKHFHVVVNTWTTKQTQFRIIVNNLQTEWSKLMRQPWQRRSHTATSKPVRGEFLSILQLILCGVKCRKWTKNIKEFLRGQIFAHFVCAKIYFAHFGIRKIFVGT